MAYRKRKDISKYCRVVGLDEIKANDYNLNITRYIDSVDSDDNVDLKTSKRLIDELETDRAKLRRDIDNIFREIVI